LTPQEKTDLLQVLQTWGSVKDRAVILLFLYTGIRLGECAALNVGDVVVTAHTGKVIVPNKKISGCRNIPLDEPARKAMLAWLVERSRRFATTSNQALIVNPKGQRISTAGLDLIVRKLGIRSHCVLSAQVLRDTFLTELAQKSKDALQVAEVSGHARIDSIRKYFELASSQYAQ
jgi:site-specific recombinase XerC